MIHSTKHGTWSLAPWALGAFVFVATIPAHADFDEISASEAGVASATAAFPQGHHFIPANPASLGTLDAWGLELNHNSWVVDILQEQMRLAVPTGTGGFGFSFDYVGYGAIDDRDSTGKVTGSVSPTDMKGALAWGWEPFSGISIGLGGTFIQKNLGTYQASGGTGNAGLQIEPWQWIGLGISYSDAGALGGVSLPGETHLGLQISPLNSRFNQTTLLGEWTDAEGGAVKLGVESTFMDLLTLRGGYTSWTQDQALGGMAGMVFGAGFKVAGWTLDYAYQPMGSLGVSHRVSLGIRGRNPVTAALEANSDSEFEGEAAAIKAKTSSRARISRQLEGSLSSSNPVIRARAIKLLVALSASLNSIEAPLHTALSDKAPEVQVAGLEALLNFGVKAPMPASVVKDLESLLKNAEGMARGNAAQVLARFGMINMTHLPDLMKTATVDGPGLPAYTAIQNSLGEKAAPQLGSTYLKHSDAPQRFAAASLLGDISYTNIKIRNSAIQRLIWALQNKNSAAVGALKKIGKPAVDALVRVYSGTEIPAHRDAILRVLCDLVADNKIGPDEKIVPLILAAFKRGDFSVIPTLGRMGESANSAVPKLDKLMQAGNEDAKEALGAMNTTESLAALHRQELREEKVAAMTLERDNANRKIGFQKALDIFNDNIQIQSYFDRDESISHTYRAEMKLKLRQGENQDKSTSVLVEVWVISRPEWKEIRKGTSFKQGALGKDINTWAKEWKPIADTKWASFIVDTKTRRVQGIDARGAMIIQAETYMRDRSKGY